MKPTNPRTVKVTRQSEAHGAACRDCGAVFAADTCPYWHWSKSVALHRYGAPAHRVELFRVAA